MYTPPSLTHTDALATVLRTIGWAAVVQLQWTNVPPAAVTLASGAYQRDVSASPVT